MQYLDDDMGELFRKASEDIRLRPENDDWDKIQKRLLPDISSLPGIITSAGIPFLNKRNNYRVWVYTIIILAFLGATFVFPTHRTAARVDFEHIQGYSRVGQSERILAEKNNSILHRSKSIRLLTFSELFKGKELNELPETEQRNAEQTHFEIGEHWDKTGFPLKLDFNKNAESYKKQVGISKGKRFYVGIIAGPQFSQTKQQGFSNAGLGGGLLVGFHLNTNLAIESGFILSNKYYESAGQYFDMSKLSATLPSGMKLIQVQSKINGLEIPINVKYDLLKVKKGNLFVSGGISSYILTNEKNQYHVSLNGNNEIMTGDYPEHQNYFAATINVSAGYECKAGKNVNLRIQPYFQIPMKGIGMGSMHVVSTGVYLGITIR